MNQNAVYQCKIGHVPSFEVEYDTGKTWLVCGNCMKLDIYSRYIKNKKVLGSGKTLDQQNINDVGVDNG